MASDQSKERGEQIWQLFNEVVDLAPEVRATRLDEACRNDPLLRHEIESLLEASMHADEILSDYEQPLLVSREVADPRSNQTDPLRLVGQTVSHYLIEAYLGGGGMGIVYKALDTKLGRMVALKFLLPRLSLEDEAKERFLHEAKASSALYHPNICTVYEIGRTSDYWMFIVMAYYEGQTLEAKIKQGELSLDKVLDYAIQIADGLSRAHEAGIVHRDLKPANLMVTRQNRIKLIDFGLAKVKDINMTGEGVKMGTIAYMSPEHTKGEELDLRTDLWGLGVVLYEMLTGSRPFGDASTDATIYAIRHDEPKPVRMFRSEVPEGLEHIVAKALAKELDKRYQHASEILVDLRLQQGGHSPQRKGGVAFAPSRRLHVVLSGSVAVLVLAVLSYLFVRLGMEVAPAEDRPSIAVLPSESLSEEEEHAYFAAGMTDEVTATLTRIEGLHVVPHQSVMGVKAPGQSLKELAQLLHVNYFISCSMLWAGEQVRITVNLIDPATETTLWGDSFVRAKYDVLALQQEVVRAILQEIEIQLTPQDEARLGQVREIDPKAYELYRHGKYIFEQSGLESMYARLQKAMPYFEQAIAIDSTYAEAYAQLGIAHWWFGKSGGLPWAEVLPIAGRYMDKAMGLDDKLPLAYITKSVILQEIGNWSEAEVALRRAIDLNPGDASTYCELGLLLLRIGRIKEALDQATNAYSRDPVSRYAHQVISQAYLFSREYDEVIAWSKKWQELYPRAGLWQLGSAYLEKGLYKDALATFKDMVSTDSSDFSIGFLGQTYAVMGRRDEALKVLAELKTHGAIYGIAEIYTALGEPAQALDWLEQYEGYYSYLKVWLPFTPLHSEPRFQALLKKKKLDL